MNKLVLALFIAVLIITLGVIGFYLYSTFSTSPKPSTFELSSPSPSPSPISFSGISFTEAKIQAQKDCKKIGSTYEEAKDYLENLFQKTTWQEGGIDTFSVIDIGDSCWGVVVSDSEGEGNFYYENSQNILTVQKISQFNP